VSDSSFIGPEKGPEKVSGTVIVLKRVKKRFLTPLSSRCPLMSSGGLGHRRHVQLAVHRNREEEPVIETRQNTTEQESVITQNVT